jgi:hypothetical protein
MGNAHPKIALSVRATFPSTSSSPARPTDAAVERIAHLKKVEVAKAAEVLLAGTNLRGG